MNLTLLSIFLAILSPVAFGHTRLSKFNGNSECVRPTNSDSKQYDPLFPRDFGKDYFTCNHAGTEEKKPCVVQAGDTISLSWTHDGSGNSGGYLDISHAGPCMLWAADKGNPDKWFKVWEDGYNENRPAGQKFCNEVITKKGTVELTIPRNFPSGNYLFRTELIALHDGDKRGGAQFYISCVDVVVQGSAGSLPPDSLAKRFGNGQSPYTEDDPGIFFSLYNGKNASYQIPGGPVAFGGSSSSSAYSSAASSGYGEDSYASDTTSTYTSAGGDSDHSTSFSSSGASGGYGPEAPSSYSQEPPAQDLDMDLVQPSYSSPVDVYNNPEVMPAQSYGPEYVEEEVQEDCAEPYMRFMKFMLDRYEVPYSELFEEEEEEEECEDDETW